MPKQHPTQEQRQFLVLQHAFKIIHERKGRDREQNLLLAVSLRSVHLGALHGWNRLLPISLVAILGQVDDDLGRPLPRELGPPVGATVAGFTSPSEPSLEEGSMLESMAPMARTERACPLAKASPLWEPPHEG